MGDALKASDKLYVSTALDFHTTMGVLIATNFSLLFTLTFVSLIHISHETVGPFYFFSLQ